MSDDLSPSDRAKRAAAHRAAEAVRDGMKVGLGTGSTAAFLVRRLGKRARREGLRFRAVPTSEATARLARAEGIELADLSQVGWLDLTIDGADEADGSLNLIKGGGGALLREKIVAAASDRMIVIADAGKRVAQLGAYPLPVEVVPFGWQATRRLIEEALAGMDVEGRDIALRMTGDVPFRTDEGNRILDLRLHRIGDPRRLSVVLNQVPGVVETGLFLDMCDTMVLGHPDGSVEEIRMGAPDEEGLVPFRGRDNVFGDLAE